MKIPNNLITALLHESQTFRTYAASILEDSGSDSITRNRVEDLVKYADDKIDAIKKVRTFVENNTQAFQDAYPRMELLTYESGRKSLGLADSKRFVESIRDFN